MKKEDKSGETRKKPSVTAKIASSLLNKLLLKILLILILLTALFFGGRAAWHKIIDIKTEKSFVVAFREIERCAELVSVKSTYSDIISIKKTRIAGFAKSFSIIKYTGVIRGGISDISKAKITVKRGGKSVKVELPKAEVLSNDISNIEVFDEGKSIFVSISVKEIMAEIRFNQESASAQILETGFLEEAQKQACKIIESVLYAAGFEEVSVS